jgi:predicted nucleic acid-binding protein
LAAPPPSISIDTGVLVEFIDEAGDLHSEAKVVVESVASGKLVGLVAHPVFAEFFYVSERLYENSTASRRETGGNPDMRAEQLIRWLFASPGIVMPENNLELALQAGKIKRKFAFALTDSYVIAAAKLNRCKALFKSPEEEMNLGNKLDKLKRDEEVEIVFLEEYSF